MEDFDFYLIPTCIALIIVASIVAFVLARPADRAIEKYERELKQELQETSIYTQRGGHVETN